jgi:7-cyano-7-deazaguanine synthase
VVNLYLATQEMEILKALTFDYGQRAAENEIHSAQEITRLLQIEHETISLPFLARWTKTALVQKDLPLPQLSIQDLNHLEKTQQTAHAVWVPNRNGIFLNIAAGLAESLGASWIIVGFNQEEGATFPDNSKAFVSALNLSFSYSTQIGVKVWCKTLHLDKRDIVRIGLDLKIPFQKLWSCYEKGSRMCGTCESCLRLKRAILEVQPKLLEEIPLAHPVDS